MNFTATCIEKFPGYACIRVKAPENVSRQPIHLCVVLDTSASMDEGNKLENVRQSMKFLLDFLGPQDKLSIITFSQHAKIVMSGVPISSDEKENIRARISLITSESNTNLSAGIITSQDCLLTNSGCKQSILILTDGHANIGMTTPSDITKLSKNLCRLYPDTSISTVGYGTGHNVELLQNISSEGGGSYYVVNDIEDVAQVFGDILGGLLTCAAQQVTVCLPLNTELKTRYAVHNSSLKSSDNKDTCVLIGDMPAGMEASFIAKLSEGVNISVKGYDLQINEKIMLLGTVKKVNDSVLQAECEAHYLRFAVLDIIEKARKALVDYSIDTSPILNDIQHYSLQIVNYKENNTNPVWDILLEELKECNENLVNRSKNRYYNTDSAQVMAQRTTYLGRMKGIAAKGITPRSYGLSQQQEQSPLPRGFSNIAQRQISSQLQSQMSPSVVQHSSPQMPPAPPLVSEIGRQIARCSS